MRKKIKIDYMLYVILFMLPFIHVNVGINISDQGYNLANFKLFPDINSTWRTATLVANLFGKALTYLPFGKYMLGMNIYCTLLLSLSVVGIFYFLKKEYSKYAVFCGLLIAICLSWAPKVALYQYLSYYLFSFAIIILVNGIHYNKRKYLFGAGAILGINLFVRFPNILECTLIIVLLYAAFVYKMKWKDIGLNCICCIGGYMLIAIIGVALIEIVFGNGTYVSMISGLFGMTDTAAAYSPYYMVEAVLASYEDNWRWFRWFLIVAIIGSFLAGFKMKKWVKYILYVICALSCLVILRILWYYGKINFMYTSYDSIHTTGAIFLLFCLVILTCMIILPNIEKKKRLYALSAIVVVVITPLGSNNVLYTNYNNLFLVAPIVLGSVCMLLKMHSTDGNTEKRIWEVDLKPLRIVVSSLVCLVMFQSIMFHLCFIYGGYGIFNEGKVSVEKSDVLVGMLTNEENAEMLNGLSDFISGQEWRNKECIVFSNAPMIFYILDLKCAIGHTWPALDSYPKDEFLYDINKMESLPIIIYETRYFGDLLTEIPETDTKTYYIYNLLNEGKYEEVYSNAHYAVCIPENYE